MRLEPLWGAERTSSGFLRQSRFQVDCGLARLSEREIATSLMRFHTDYSHLPDNSNPNRNPCTKVAAVSIGSTLGGIAFSRVGIAPNRVRIWIE